ERQGPADPRPQRPRNRRRARGRRGADRLDRRHRRAPADHVPAPARSQRASRRLRPRHHELEEPEWSREDQRRHRGTPRLHREPHHDELEAYADSVIDGYTELAPNFKGSIMHRQVIGPYEMEQEYGLIGGNIFHGELSLEQLFHMRPAPGYADYRSPIKGLYQA